MKPPYDIHKNAENIAKHGIEFETVSRFNWESAVTKEDTRYDYGERRFISYGNVGDRLHTLVWTLRNGAIRPISFRKANEKEKKRYEKEQS